MRQVGQLPRIQLTDLQPHRAEPYKPNMVYRDDLLQSILFFVLFNQQGRKSTAGFSFKNIYLKKWSI